MCVVATERRRGAFSSEVGHETHIALLRFGAAERNWKVYQSICTKERSRLGQLKKKTFAAIVDDANVDVDEEDKEAQTSSTKLIFVKGNLHCAGYNDYVLGDAENELRSFDASDSAAFDKLVEDFNADRDPLSNDTRRVFCNYLEYWGRLQTQDDDLAAWLR